MNLLHMACANDRGGDGWMVVDPGDGQTDWTIAVFLRQMRDLLSRRKPPGFGVALLILSVRGESAGGG